MEARIIGVDSATAGRPEGDPSAMESDEAAETDAPLLTVLLTSVSRCQMSLSRVLPGARKSEMSGLGRLSYRGVSVTDVNKGRAVGTSPTSEKESARGSRAGDPVLPAGAVGRIIRPQAETFDFARGMQKPHTAVRHHVSSVCMNSSSSLSGEDIARYALIDCVCDSASLHDQQPPRMTRMSECE